jgi:hypothetical protein
MRVYMKNIFLLFILILVVTQPCQAIVSHGINYPDTLMAGTRVIVFNGAGIRTKSFIDMYAAALYLNQKQSNYVKIIEADEPMAIRLNILSQLITPKNFIENTRAGFERSTRGNTAPIETKIDRMCSVFKDQIRKGDIFDLIYVPGVGTQIYHNGKLKTTIEGLDLKKAMFGIWIIDNPWHGCEPMRRGMLGLE